MAEFDHQATVARMLQLAGLTFCGCIAGANLGRAARGKARAAGYIAGEPDLRIYDPPPAHPGKVGTMLEMKVPSKKPKTDRAQRFAGCDPHQRARLTLLEALGWHCIVGYGAHDALQKLAAAGYPLPRLPMGV